MITFETRLANFLDTVSFVADKERQEQQWKEHMNLTSIISLDELYAQFFDDNDIDNFINDELQSVPLSAEQRLAIVGMRDALDRYGKRPGNSSEFQDDTSVLVDPEWNSIVELAKATLEKF